MDEHLGRRPPEERVEVGSHDGFTFLTYVSNCLTAGTFFASSPR